MGSGYRVLDADNLNETLTLYSYVPRGRKRFVCLWQAEQCLRRGYLENKKILGLYAPFFDGALRFDQDRCAVLDHGVDFFHFLVGHGDATCGPIGFVFVSKEHGAAVDEDITAG